MSEVEVASHGNSSLSKDIATPYNSRIIQVWLRFLEQQYPSVDVSDVLGYAGMKLYEVQDDGHWFSQTQVDRFYEKTLSLTENHAIAREAGRFSTALETRAIWIRRYLIGLLGPLRAYRILEQSASLITKATTFSVRVVSDHKVEVISTPKPGIQEKPYQCENRLGILESFAFTFNQSFPSVEHPECTTRGDPHCRYVIEWKPNIVSPLRRVRHAFAAASVLGSIATFPFLPITSWLILTLCLVSANYAVSLFAKNREYEALTDTVEELRKSTEELELQTRINYNNTTVSHDVGEAISKYTRIDDVLDHVVRIFEKQLDYDRGVIMLADHARTRLFFKTGFGYNNGDLELLKKTEFHLDKKDSKGVFVLSFRELESYLVNDVDVIRDDLSSRSLEFVRRIGTRSFICCPIVCEREALGVLAVDNIQTKKPLVNSDLNMLSGIASVIGMSVKNAQLIQSREEQFKSIIQALASSIDARDNLTAGHSEKVTEYSVGVCRELKLSRDFEEMIRIAAMLHDYGKIGIPDSILKKKGPLTDDEFAIIRTHASKTREILEQVAFDGIYAEVPEVASSHHERLDGTGYPQGLRGDEISLGARIIAVADFYEAITSQRHYRDPLDVEQAIDLLVNEADSHLDSRVISAFIGYLKKNDLISIEPDLSRLTVLLPDK